MKKAFPRWAVYLFFAVFLALGLLTAADYGPTWDESTEMDILRMNLWEYARVLNLDQGTFEALAAREDPLAIETLRPISQSVEQDHGAAVFYPFSAVVLDLSLSGGARSALWHMACWAVFTLGGFALYAALRQLALDSVFRMILTGYGARRAWPGEPSPAASAGGAYVSAREVRAARTCGAGAAAG